ncbi:hypothetical protein AMTRI_Chr03g148750 [Amborella trichopoda]
MSKISLRPFQLSYIDDFMALASSICLIQGSCPGLCRGEIGYVLASKYWGQGHSNTCSENECGSQRVLGKAGFKREGLLRKYFIHKGKTIDTFIYSFLSTDSIK